MYFPQREGKCWHYEGVQFNSTRNILLRAVCNLVVVDFRESIPSTPKMAEIDLD